MAEYKGEWAKKDAAGLAEFLSDWQTTLKRYNAASDAATEALNRNTIPPILGFNKLVPEALLPMEDIFQAIVHADQANPPTVTRGDLQDLVQRLAAVGAAIAPGFTVQPTPQTGSAFLESTAWVKPLVDHPLDTFFSKPDPTKTGWWESKPFAEKLGLVTLGALGGLVLVKTAKIL